MSYQTPMTRKELDAIAAKVEDGEQVTKEEMRRLIQEVRQRPRTVLVDARRRGEELPLVGNVHRMNFLEPRGMRVEIEIEEGRKLSFDITANPTTIEFPSGRMYGVVVEDSGS